MGLQQVMRIEDGKIYWTGGISTEEASNTKTSNTELIPMRIVAELK